MNKSHSREKEEQYIFLGVQNANLEDRLFQCFLQVCIYRTVHILRTNNLKNIYGKRDLTNMVILNHLVYFQNLLFLRGNHFIKISLRTEMVE